MIFMQIKKEKWIKIIFLLPFVLLVIGITLSFVCFHSSYARVMHYSVKYPNNDIPIIGNVFYPKQTGYEKPPVVVYMSGFMMQKDLDPRVPMEFCRRGFVVVNVDMHGHGEMDGIFGPMAYFDSKNVIQYIFDYLHEVVNTSQLAVIGHSAGGMGALGLNDSRVQATVTWASPVFYSEELIENFENVFQLYNPQIDLYNRTLIEELNASAPYTFINATNPKNLLAIHHINDPIVNISHGYAIHNKTQCEFIVLNETERAYALLNGMDETTHGMLYDSVIMHTVNWIEEKLGLNTVTISLDYNYRSKIYLVAFSLVLFGFLGSGFSLVYYFCINTHSSPNSEPYLTRFGERMIQKYTMKLNQNLRQILPFIVISVVFLLGYLISWIFSEFIRPFNMNWVFGFPSIFLCIVLILYFLMVRERFSLDSKGVLFGLGSSIILLVGFSAYTFGFRSLIVYPHPVTNILYAIPLIAVYIISSSITLWKILIRVLPDLVFDPLTKFSEKTVNFIQTRIFRKDKFYYTELRKQVIKFRWKIIYITFIQLLCNLMIVNIVPFAINILIVAILLVISGLMSALYYYFRREIIGMIIMTIVILSFFYATCYWFFPSFTHFAGI